MIPEIREIPGFPGYGASADGRIWSSWKWGRKEIGPTWREMTQRRKRGTRYQQVNIGPYKGQICTGVHRLVAAAFFGPIPEGMEVNHLDGNPENNTPLNLEIVTRLQNEVHALANGLKPRGESHGCAIYTEAQIRALKQDAAVGGMTQKQLAEVHGIKLPTVQAILTGRQWTHV